MNSSFLSEPQEKILNLEYDDNSVNTRRARCKVLYRFHAIKKKKRAKGIKKEFWISRKLCNSPVSNLNLNHLLLLCFYQNSISTVTCAAQFI